MAYSTIRQKKGECEICGKYGPLTAKKCGNCYWVGVKMKSLQRLEERENDKDESLQTVIADLDIIFSRYIRQKDADKNGFVVCVTCGVIGQWRDFQCGHFIPRAHLYTRFSELNCHVQCPTCNELKRGNIPAYSKYLERTRPGSVEILLEQGHTVYKYSVSELKGLISEYSAKIKQLPSNH